MSGQTWEFHITAAGVVSSTNGEPVPNNNPEETP